MACTVGVGCDNLKSRRIKVLAFEILCFCGQRGYLNSRQFNSVVYHVDLKRCTASFIRNSDGLLAVHFGVITGNGEAGYLLDNAVGVFNTYGKSRCVERFAEFVVRFKGYRVNRNGRNASDVHGEAVQLIIASECLNRDNGRTVVISVKRSVSVDANTGII